MKTNSNEPATATETFYSQIHMSGCKTRNFVEELLGRPLTDCAESYEKSDIKATMDEGRKLSKYMLLIGLSGVALGFLISLAVFSGGEQCK